MNDYAAACLHRSTTEAADVWTDAGTSIEALAKHYSPDSTSAETAALIYDQAATAYSNAGLNGKALTAWQEAGNKWVESSYANSLNTKDAENSLGHGWADYLSAATTPGVTPARQATIMNKLSQPHRRQETEMISRRPEKRLLHVAKQFYEKCKHWTPRS